MKLDNIIYLFCLLLNLVSLFAYCYYGSQASECFAKIPRYFYDTNWLLLETKLKKYLIIMISNAQCPFIYHGSGIVDLKLATFASVSTNTNIFPVIYFDLFNDFS